jgi:hypothetical protein
VLDGASPPKYRVSEMHTLLEGGVEQGAIRRQSTPTGLRRPLRVTMAQPRWATPLSIMRREVPQIIEISNVFTASPE